MIYKDIPLATGLPLLFDEWQKDVRCIIVARIESYNKNTRKATITPLLNRTFPSGDTIQYKPIQDVPCAFIGGENLQIDIEYVQGDNVLCAVSDYSIDNYITSDGTSNYTTAQTSHELQDVMVLMGIAPENKTTSKNKIVIGSEGNLTLKNSNGYLTLKKDGQIDLNRNLTIDA